MAINGRTQQEDNGIGLNQPTARLREIGLSAGTLAVIRRVDQNHPDVDLSTVGGLMQVLQDSAEIINGTWEADLSGVFPWPHWAQLEDALGDPRVEKSTWVKDHFGESWDGQTALEVLDRRRRPAPEDTENPDEEDAHENEVENPNENLFLEGVKDIVTLRVFRRR